MLLSDRDIRSAIEAKRIMLEPYDADMVQPSSVDVRLDRYFRVFENHRYPHIDPAADQPDLTRMVEPIRGEPFVLHPGEFVLASTFEVITLGDDLSARLEGKALALDTPVPTPKGWVEMADLAPGDDVFDEQGQPTAVVAATDPMTNRRCMRVEFSDGAAIVADASHLWRTVSKADRMHRRHMEGAVRTTEEIASTLRTGGERNHHIPLCGPVEYAAQELPIDPYVLGIWLGDGTRTKAEITVGRQDEEILDHVRSAGYSVWPASSPHAYRIGGLSPGQRGRKRDAGGHFTADGSISSLLRRLGLTEGKYVPEGYLRSSVRQRLALLQGLMDSDGYVDVYGRCEFVNTNRRLADAVAELARSLGLRATRRTKRAKLYGVDCGPAYQVKFTPRIEVFRVRRKLARLKNDNRAHRFHAVVDVSEVPAVPVRCIQVAAPSGMFLAGESFIPTHNSSLGRLGLLTHSTAGFIDAGFSGHVTLELSNVATLPIKLWPGMKIGQLCFFQLSSPAEFPYGSAEYGSRYQGQRGPTPSRSHHRFHRTDV